MRRKYDVEVTTDREVADRVLLRFCSAKLRRAMLLKKVQIHVQVNCLSPNLFGHTREVRRARNALEEESLVSPESDSLLALPTKLISLAVTQTCLCCRKWHSILR